jgi:hypothetical protein
MRVTFESEHGRDLLGEAPLLQQVRAFLDAAFHHPQVWRAAEFRMDISPELPLSHSALLRQQENPVVGFFCAFLPVGYSIQPAPHINGVVRASPV